MENTVFDEIHIWNFPQGTTIQIKPELISRLNFIRKLKFKTIKAFHESIVIGVPFTSFKNYLKPSFPNFRDLHVLLKICSGLNISLEELEASVIAYQFKKSRITISNPILPIKVSPLFPMLIAHMIADGNIVRFKNKKTIYFSYRQFDRKIRLLLLEKLRALFGIINYRKNYFVDGTRIYVPEVLTLVLCDYYCLNGSSFLSETAILPDKIVNSPNSSLLAVLIAFIIDEGHVDSSGIIVSLKNKRLIEQLSQICNKLFYKNSIGHDQKRGMYFLYILKQGTINFWRDYLQLKAEYPVIDLCYKEEKLKADIERFSKEWKSHGANKTKNLIIQSLKNKSATAWDLAKELHISRQGIRHQANGLFLKGILSRKKVQESAFLYSLKKESYFEEADWGKSNPVGWTKLKIKNLLSSPKTTVELAKAIKIDSSDLRLMLNQLCKNREIECLGKQHTGAMPTRIWIALNSSD